MRMEGFGRRGMLERTSSIEKEPMTLHRDQLRLAREEALYVLSTRSMEEAWAIFTKGLKPVVSANTKNMDMDFYYGDDDDDDDGECQAIDAPASSPRDIATAPF